jgi:PKHD-type hydroxylase
MREALWYFSDLPENVVDNLVDYSSDKFDDSILNSTVGAGGEEVKIRKSKNSWISTNYWIGGFIWHYVMKANRENFLYDLTNIEQEHFQYTHYFEGDFYNWHADSSAENMYESIANIDDVGKEFGQPEDKLARDFCYKNSESIRKLSVVVQLSDPDDYVGGNLQLLDEKNILHVAPRRRGTIIFFDSRMRHRVVKVKKGHRKTLVGWVSGPRWK